MLLTGLFREFLLPRVLKIQVGKLLWRRENLLRQSHTRFDEELQHDSFKLGLKAQGEHCPEIQAYVTEAFYFVVIELWHFWQDLTKSFSDLLNSFFFGI